MKFRDTVNKIVIVIGCLVLMAALTALFLFPATVLTAVGNWLLGWGQAFQGGALWPGLAIGGLLSLLAIVVLGLIIYWEVKPRRRRFIRVQQVAGGMARVSTDSVKEMLEHRLDSMPGVVNVDSHVRAHGSRVGVGVNADVVRGTNVPDTANQIIKVTQRVLTDDLGLQIDGTPEVSVTVVKEEGLPEARGRRREVRPARQREAPSPVEPIAAYEGGERVEERRREPVVAEEKPPEVPRTERREPVVTQPEEQRQETKERWLYEVEESQPPEEVQTRSDRGIPVVYEREMTDEEEEPIDYHPSQQKLVDPFEQGKETRP